jgi:hypothetical protein
MEDLKEVRRLRQGRAAITRCVCAAALRCGACDAAQVRGHGTVLRLAACRCGRRVLSQSSAVAAKRRWPRSGGARSQHGSGHNT